MPVRKIRIAITLGDPAGVGPEIITKAIHEYMRRDVFFIVIGRAKFLKIHYPALFKSLLPIPCDDINSTTQLPRSYRGFLVDVQNELPIPQPGKGTVNTGAESLQYIDTAIELWKHHFIDAIVTAPVSKSLIEKSGTSFSGHTEYIANKIGEKDPYMMMYSKKYRVILCTTHIPISRIETSLTTEKIVNTIIAGKSAITAIDGKEPKIAICGLDPHCGDDGAISNFDKDITINAVQMAKNLNANVQGPFSADTLFLPHNWAQYNLVVAMYHDQGLIPFKMLAFDRGVNVTLGLSLVRTSVDHGTGFDIAGKGIANHRSMYEAIALAKKLSQIKMIKGL